MLSIIQQRRLRTLYCRENIPCQFSENISKAFFNTRLKRSLFSPMRIVCYFDTVALLCLMLYCRLLCILCGSLISHKAAISQKCKCNCVFRWQIMELSILQLKYSFQIDNVKKKNKNTCIGSKGFDKHKWGWRKAIFHRNVMGILYAECMSICIEVIFCNVTATWLTDWLH